MTRPRKGNANFRLNQALTGNQKLSTDSDQRMDMIWSELMKKLETLDENIKMLDRRVAENALTIKRQIGRLPGSTDANPRRQVSAVLLRSGKRLTPITGESTSVDNPVDIEKAKETRSEPIIIDPEPICLSDEDEDETNVYR